MDISKIKIGDKVPDEFNTIIEIPAGVNPVKYEIDKESGMLIVDRFVATAMFYPCNYGFVPNTLAEDGDPLDVLVFTHMPVVAGSVIKVRPIGFLNMEDEAGKDAKILCVPVNKVTKYYKDIITYKDLPELTLSQIKHFFENYKGLEEGKWVKVGDYQGVDEAKVMIIDSIKRYKH
ncbi:MAG: inorganic diphosphatase [Alphaproteobacteria bacterium]|jgi:inorganic pyrophosphatase|nr:inorganic diphosphatase [Alphaproteobacteria bacterium]